MKQADDDFAAADKADCEARQATVDTKQAEKDAAAAVITATKASVDAKASEKKDADQLKKLQMNVEAAQRKVKDISTGMTLTGARDRISKMDKNNEEKKAKFDKATELLAATIAKMEDWKNIGSSKSPTAKRRSCVFAERHARPKWKKSFKT